MTFPAYAAAALVLLFGDLNGTPEKRAAQVQMAAQIEIESAWKPEARSRFAAGLAQFTPPTWGDWAPRVGCEGAPETDPECSMLAQYAYMRALLQSKSCRSMHSIAAQWICAWRAYNGGLGYINREVRACATVRGCDPTDPADIERLCTAIRADWACRENLAYAPKIIEAMQRYAR